MSTPIRPSPPRTPIPPRPLSVPPSAITLPSTPVQGFAGAFPGPSAVAPSPSPSPSTAPAPMGMFSAPPLSRDWYVYQPDGRHIGPVSTSFLANGWVARQVPRDVFVGAAGDPSWRPLGQVPEIMDAVRAIESTHV